MSAAQAAPPAAAEHAEGEAPATAPKEGKSVSSWSTKKLLYTLRVANMSNGLLLVLTGILVFITGMVNVTFSTITVSGYVVFFGMLMTCLECNIGNLAPRFKRNFGFLFSFIGRTVFIIFCATMCFALNAWLGYLAGAVTAGASLQHGIVASSRALSLLLCQPSSVSTHINPPRLPAPGDPAPALQ